MELLLICLNSALLILLKFRENDLDRSVLATKVLIKQTLHRIFGESCTPNQTDDYFKKEELGILKSWNPQIPEQSYVLQTLTPGFPVDRDPYVSCWMQLYLWQHIINFARFIGKEVNPELYWGSRAIFDELIRPFLITNVRGIEIFLPKLMVPIENGGIALDVQTLPKPHTAPKVAVSSPTGRQGCEDPDLAASLNQMTEGMG